MTWYGYKCKHTLVTTGKYIISLPVYLKRGLLYKLRYVLAKLVMMTYASNNETKEKSMACIIFIFYAYKNLTL